MCGRFVLISDLSVITEEFEIGHVVSEYIPNSNVLPGHHVYVVTNNIVNCLYAFRWGLIPAWASDPSIGSRLINARAETLAEKPSFRNAFKKRRCLIIADAFYESQKVGSKKISVSFRLKSGIPFGFAGLYETWTSPDDQPVATCTIVTTEPNDLIRPVHNRMPVIVPKERASTWLNPVAYDQKALLSILQPYPSSEMEIAPF
jgi:putative SOS response-associated peptidase YedK